jgi:hypothetical protein
MNCSSGIFSVTSSPAVAREEGIFKPHLPEISDDVIDGIVNNIEKNGFAVIQNYIRDDDIIRLQSFVENLVSAAGGEYVALTGAGEIANTPFEEIGKSEEFIRLIHRVYEKGYNTTSPDQSLYQVLRCLKGKSGLRHAYFFHYDSYVVTALLPIVIPTRGKSGDLIMIPNLRRIRLSYLLNLIDKVFIDNKVSQLIFKYIALKNISLFKKVRIVPGSLYFFWGYRTLHANEACDVDKIRATALFHFVDPHIKSNLRKFTGRTKFRATIKEGKFP